jgi:zinc transport system ATP-binding protein
MAQKAIELEKVFFSYNGESAVRDVTFSIDKGDFLGIIGPNGGGKTTLLRLILGVLNPQTGVIRLLGGEPRRSRIAAGYVPQEAASNKGFPISLRDAIFSGLAARRGMGRGFTKEDSVRVDALIEELGLLALRARTIGELSGGQRQKVLLARALVAKPEILFLDEPTSSIDATGSDEIYAYLRKLNAEGTTVVLVTHNIGVVSQYIKSIACINKELHFHPEGKLTEETITRTFGCPIDLIAHGIPHRVFGQHEGHGHD